MDEIFLSKIELVEGAMGIVQGLQKPTEKHHLHKVFLKGPKLNNEKKKSGIHAQLCKKVQMYRRTTWSCPYIDKGTPFKNVGFITG